MDQVIPKNLNYNTIKPIGYPSQVRMEKFTPISFNTSTQGVSASDVIRFNISSTGFWDPYSAYIKIEVDCSQMDGTKDVNTTNKSIGSQQVDNSAQSFISQLIISKSGTEIERIEEYDTISAILNDIHGSNDNRSVRNFEGMNAQQLPMGQNYVNRTHQMNNLTTNSGQQICGYNPLINQVLGYTAGIENEAYYFNVTPASITSQVQRYEYQNMYIDAKQTLQTTTTQPYAYMGTIANADSSAKFCMSQFLSGYQQPFCPQLSSYTNEAVLSKNIPQSVTYKGKLGQLLHVDRQTFCIPLVSGLLGVLMPQDSYRYIPMTALQDLILEFRLNPYAMFTSGYNDFTTAANSGNATNALNTTTNPMLTRSWRITKFEINVEMQYFSPTVEQIILSKLNTSQGIVLHTNSWLLGPRYSIPANTAPNGTYSVNLAFESLKTVLFCFMPDDFYNYSFCRKQFRLSANILNYYLKIGSNYYPPLPISGHAGNSGGYSSVNNENDQSNCDFLIQTYKAFGKFNDIQTSSILNSVNFAVNQRAYDPTNTASLYTTTGTKWTNLDTAVSLPSFHENRCVGRAVYAMDLETVNHDQSVMSGIDTLNNKNATPYEITIKGDQNNTFTRPYTMYIFNQFDLLIRLTSNSVQIYGKG